MILYQVIQLPSESSFDVATATANVTSCLGNMEEKDLLPILIFMVLKNWENSELVVSFCKI